MDDFVAIGVFSGVDAVVAFFAELFAAVPDFRIDVLNVTAEGDTAVVQWHATGTFTGGPFQGIHATGRSVDLRGCDVMRFDGGLLKHNAIYYDGLAFARQIGLLPTEGSSADRALQAVFNARTDALAQVKDLRR
ncbi:MAG: ester cyclase [Jiangellales bacterium]